MSGGHAEACCLNEFGGRVIKRDSEWRGNEWRDLNTKAQPREESGSVIQRRIRSDIMGRRLALQSSPYCVPLLKFSSTCPEPPLEESWLVDDLVQILLTEDLGSV
jgi:hypothetical protein